MGQTVKLRRSAVSGKKPTNDQLELGELSVNTTDGKIFLSKSGSNGPSVEEIVTTNSDITGSINISGDITGSIFTGSFKGDGSELYNIPSDAIIGLTLNQISSGSSTATIDEDSLQINVDTVITGSLTATEITGSGLGLTDVPVYISGSGADNLPYDGTYTKLHFDESTGIKVETNNTTGVAKIFLSGVAAEGAGDGRTAKLSVATPSTTWTFNHGLGEKYPSITVFGSNDEVIIPQTIDVVSDSQLVVTFSTPQSGVVTATVGGGLPSSNNDEGKVLSIDGDGSPTWKGGILSSSITFDTYTSSVDDKITSLETESGSIRGDFDTYTSSNDDRLDDIEVSTGSLNSFTSSINTTIKTKLNNDNVISGSVQVDIEDTTNYDLVDGRITDLESFSSSIDTIFATDNDVTTLRSDFNTITSSFDGRLDSLESESGSIRSDFNTITSSFDGRLDSIETSTSSLNSFTGSINTTIKTKLNNDNVVSGSVQINIEDTTNYNLVSGRLDDIETSTGSLNGFTSSINTTIKNKLNNDNVVSGSVQINIEDTTNYNLVDGRLDSIETKTGSLEGRLDDIEVSTSSLNSFTSSINTTIKNKLNNDNVVSGSVQVDIEDTTNYDLVDDRITDLESFSSSIDTIFATDSDVTTLRGDFNSHTSSFNTITSSFDGRLDSLETESGSIRIDFNTITSSFDGRLDSLESESSSIRSDFSTHVSTFNTITSSFDGRLDSLETESGSIRIDFNTITSSFDGRLDSLELKTGSIETVNTTQNGRLSSIESKTGSYITGYTETDPIFMASPSSNITSTNISNWNTAHGWGDHSIEGYLTSHPSVSSASSSNNSGRTYIQDILLDGFGHITGITTSTETVVNTDTNYYVTGATFNNTTGLLRHTRNDGTNIDVDLLSTLSDVTVTGGTYNSGNQTLTLTKSDGNSLDVSGFAIDTDVNWYTTSATFNTSNGIITGTRNDGGTWSVDLDGRYLTGYTETDPIFTASPSAGITTTNITNWNTAYGWGNHASVGYLTSIPTHNHTSLTGVTSISFNSQSSDTSSISTTISGTGTYFDFNLTDDNNNDWWRWRFTPSGGSVYDAMVLKPVSNGNANLIISGTVTADNLNVSNWDTAYGWGNHASVGYLTSYNNYYTTSAIFNTSNGIITGTRNDGGTWTVDIDGRYSLNTHTHVPTDINNFVGSVNIDTYDQNGMWASLHSNTGSGTPPGNYYNIINLSGDGTGRGTQLATYYGSNNNFYVRSRTDNSNAWLPWTQVWTSDVFTNNSTNWDTAYSWGDHANVGYLTSYNDYYTTGATFNTGNGIITGTRNDGGTWTVDIDGRYLTSYTETDTLDSVADRGRTTNQQLISTNPSGFRVDSGAEARIEIDSNNNWSYLRLMDNGVTSWDLATFNDGDLEFRPGGGTTGRFLIDKSGNATTNGDFNVQSGHTLRLYRSGGSAHQRGDSRLDGTDQSRLHWYGKNDTDGTANFKHAWYDGTNYINVTASSGGRVTFDGSGSEIYIGTNKVATESWVTSQNYLTSYNDYYTTGATFNTGNGIITGTRNDGGTWTVDIDGRYLTSYTETDTLASVIGRGNTTSGFISFTGTGVTSGIRFNSATVANDAFGIRVNGTSNDGELEFYSTDDDTEPFVFRHYTVGQDGTGTSVEWFRIGAGGNISTPGTITASGYNKTNWDTAHGWGNHASAGYIVVGSTIPQSAAWSGATKFKSAGDISQGAGNHSLQIYSDTNNDAFMAFHINADYAVHFGLDDSSNRLYTGGWSAGTGAKYQIWDSRDFSGTNISNWNTAYGWGNHAGLYASSSHTHSDLTTNYVGGQQTNPQTYFGRTTGLKVAMTGVPSVWADTLWINGYAGSDVKNMCALHTLRNGQPRMYISTQLSDATSYGSFYEILSQYNYNTFTPTLTGSGASGTWNISVTGNAGYASVSGNSDKLDNLDSTQFLRSDTSDTMSGVLTINHTNDNQILLTSPSSWTGIGFNDGQAGATDYIWHNGAYNTFAIGGGGSSVSGKQLHIHGGVTIGSGYSGTSVSPNGLNVEGPIQSAGTIGSNTSQSRDKIRVWNDGNYTIGFKTGFGFGHLGNSIGTTTEYAMTFQTNNQSGRGWWWGTSSDNDNQGSMGLSNEGRANIKTSLSIGEGNTTAPSTTPLYVEGSTSGSTVFEVQGTQGQLFSVTDDLTGDIFEVSDISGIPILKVNASGTVTIDGTLQVTEDVFAYYASDKNLKKNIKPIENAIDKLKLIGGYSFDWIEGKTKNTGHDVGVIAQEIEEVLPELVGLRGDGYKGVKYEKLTALLIETNKELVKRVEELEKKLK